MFYRIWNLLREHLALSLKCGSVLFLLIVSVLVVACGASNSAADPGAPPVTVTINLNQTFASPTPTLPPYSCGAWATQTTPAFSPNGVVAVYAKFVHNVNGNPEGMNQATAVATIQWPDGQTQMQNKTTTSDGLAFFQIPLQASAINHVVLVNVNFTSADGQRTCKAPEPAFFTAILVTPTASPSAAPSGTSTPGGTPSDTPSPTPKPRKSPLPIP
jgi:hypothetical protein